MKKVVVQFLIFTGLFLAIWFGLSQLPWVRVLREKQFSEKQQENLGKMVLRMHRADHMEIEADSITSILVSIRDRLCKANNIDTGRIHMHLFRDEQVNAFALPGGHIIVNTALIQQCDNGDALAGVIAHEIGHLMRDHVTKKLTREIGLSALMVLAGGDGNFALLKEVLRTLTTSSFDRDQERDADKAAVRYLQHADIDPLPLADFFQQLAEDKSVSDMLEWISTHPGSAERAETIRAKRKEATYIPALDETQWETLQQGVK